MTRRAFFLLLSLLATVASTVSSDSTPVNWTAVRGILKSAAVPFAAGAAGVLVGAALAQNVAAAQPDPTAPAVYQLAPPPPTTPPSTMYGLPLLEWKLDDPSQAFTVSGSNGSSTFRFAGGPWVTGVSVKRKGTTSLGWPKPKLRLSNAGLDIWGDGIPSRSLDINSMFSEAAGSATGSSFIREALAFETYASFGVPAPRTRHAVLTLNGAFWGLVLLVERADGAWLTRQGLAGPGALLFKPEDATAANLQPGIDGATLHVAWSLAALFGKDGQDVKGKDSRVEGDAWNALEDLASALARGGGGKGGGGRRGSGRTAAHLAALVDLPGTLNYLAVAAALLHSDRCTKNHYLARSSDGFFTLLPGDSKSVIPDGALPGTAERPAPDYALTTADQFTSPLFCDAAHPQDVGDAFRAPWSTIVTAPGGLGGDGGSGGGSARRRRLAASSPSSSSLLRLRDDPKTVLAASTRSSCTADVSGAGPTGAQGTFSWLVDALLACGPVRASYLRRLERVTRAMHGANDTSGTLAPAASALAASVRAAALADNEVWKAAPAGPDAASARLLLLAAARGRQLQAEYGPGGTAVPLLPPPQPSTGLGARLTLRPLADGALAVCATAPEATGAAGATDLTGLVAVRAGSPSASLAFPPGTVVPPGGCVYGAASRADALEAADKDEGGGPGGLAVPVGGLKWSEDGTGGGEDGAWDLLGTGGASVL